MQLDTNHVEHINNETIYQPKILLRLERDQARAMTENFFPYLFLVCETRIKDSTGTNDELNSKVIMQLFCEVRTMFARKLLTSAKKFSFTFSLAESVAFYTLLLDLPINSNYVWLINLRQLVIDTLYNQMQ